MTLERKNNLSSGRVKESSRLILLYILVGFCLLNGRVIAQQNSNSSEFDLTGDWVGEITHANDKYHYTYEYALRLTQNGKEIYGTSFGEAGNQAASFELKGQYANNKLRIKDIKLVSKKGYDSNDSPCLKSLELTLVQSSQLQLKGSWKDNRRFNPLDPLNQRNPNNKCVGGTISLTKANLPTPFTDTPKYGTVAYYEFRNNDYIKRNPQKSPPTYYLNFGKKNLNMFMAKLYPEVSPKGKDFLNTVARLLQEKIEDRLNSNPKTFADLEDNSNTFLHFAYSTHYPAYCEAGWSNLTYEDRWKIIHAIDDKDFWTWNGLSVGFEIQTFCVFYKKPEEPNQSNPVKDKLKGIWNEIKKP